MSDGDESRRPGWVAWLPLIAIILVFAAWGLTHLGGTYWDTDEGLNLTKARMLQLGYGLYSEIWADQPPGLTSLLAGAFAVFGPTVQVARAVVLAHALVGLVAVAWIAREAGGGVLGAIAAAALLAISPNFAWASRAVMIGLPALSLATLAIALSLTYSRTRNRTWLAACGLALGLGLTEKLIGAYLLVPIALAVVLPSSRDTCSPDDSERDNSSRGGSSWADFSVRRALADLAIVAVFAALPAAVALVAFDARAMTDQVIGVVLRARDAYAYDLAWSVDKLGEYLLGDHLLIVGPALYGALWSLRQRSIAASVLLSWLALR
ncbi:MAG: ArnT family glycosyltransferase, partial [Anaerolineae bacterium]